MAEKFNYFVEFEVLSPGQGIVAIKVPVSIQEYNSVQKQLLARTHYVVLEDLKYGRPKLFNVNNLIGYELITEKQSEIIKAPTVDETRIINKTN